MISQTDINKVGSLPIEQVADALGLKVTRHQSLCPFHADTHPSLHYRAAHNKYRCYVCNAYGGTIDLCMQVMSLTFHDAVCWLAQAFGITINDDNVRTFDNIRPRDIKPVRQDANNAPCTTHLAQMVAEPRLTEEARHFLFDTRKLDPRVVSWCKISSTHTHLLIPYFDKESNLRSVQWRYLGNDPSQPRFRFPKGSQCHIYNLQILKMLRRNEPLFVCEGCTDCWAMMSSGHKAIAIPSATLLKTEDLNILRGLELHMFPDDDAPGERLFLQLRQATPNIIRHQLPQGCKDYAEYYANIRQGNI